MTVIFRIGIRGSRPAVLHGHFKHQPPLDIGLIEAGEGPTGLLLQIKILFRIVIHVRVQPHPRFGVLVGKWHHHRVFLVCLQKRIRQLYIIVVDVAILGGELVAVHENVLDPQVIVGTVGLEIQEKVEVASEAMLLPKDGIDLVPAGPLKLKFIFLKFNLGTKNFKF